MLIDTLKKAGINGFILSIFAAVLLGYIYQPSNIETITGNIKSITNIGVSLIFFLYGIGLDRAVLKTDLKNYRLHALIHGSTFIFFPLLAFIITLALPNEFDPILKTGIIFLASLPSTVSSSVVMVSISGGNIASAIFNAALSSLAGVFITPLIMSLYLHSAPGESIELSTVIFKLILQVILPLSIGMLLHKRLIGFYAKNKSRLKLFDQTIIVLIIYQSFAESFHQHLFSSISSASIFTLCLITIFMFFATMASIKLSCKLLDFDIKDYKTALFCGSKKSLVHGTTMSKVLFSGSQYAGIYLLPIMIYHAGQLIIGGFIAERMASKMLKSNV